MNSLINGIKSLFKKNNKKMNTERLISLKENFTGQKFQWIKTKETNLRGKVVKCKDIEPRGNKFIVYFSDGSKIDADLLNRNLMLIGDGMATLSMDEINAINGPSVQTNRKPPMEKSPMGNGPINMPDELKEFQTSKNKHVPNVSPKVSVTGASNKNTSSTDMFSMFNADETNLSLNIKIKIPNKKLLKLMYENADDKNKFLMNLSEHVYSKINNNIVEDSLEKMLVPSRKTASKKDTIVISSNASTSKKDQPIIDGSVEVTEIENGK